MRHKAATDRRIQAAGALDNDVSEILPGRVYLGSVVAAGNLKLLKSLSLTDVVVVHPKLEPAFPDEFTYTTCKAVDSYKSSILEVLETALPPLLDCLREDNKVCLVHCTKGISRSPAVVVGLLIMLGLTFEQAFHYCYKKRPAAYPNVAFQVQLRHLAQRVQHAIDQRLASSVDTEKHKSLFQTFLDCGAPVERLAASYNL